MIKFFNFCEMRNNKANCASMGLLIAKRIISARRGRMWVESGGEGQGCTFVLLSNRVANNQAMK